MYELKQYFIRTEKHQPLFSDNAVLLVSGGKTAVDSVVHVRMYMPSRSC